MTLLKSMWKSVVLAGIAGVLMFAGGAFAAAVTPTASVSVSVTQTAPSSGNIKSGTGGAVLATVTLSSNTSGFTLPTSLGLTAKLDGSSAVTLTAGAVTSVSGTVKTYAFSVPASVGAGTLSFAATNIALDGSSGTVSLNDGDTYGGKTCESGKTHEDDATTSYWDWVTTGCAGAVATAPIVSDPTISSTLTVDAVAPAAPVISVAKGKNNAVELTWTLTSNGGSAITGYKVSTDNGSTWTDLNVTTPASAFTGTITSLTNGTEYAIRLKAQNGSASSVLLSEASEVVYAIPTPPSAPDAPVLVSAIARPASILLTWTIGDDGGSAITGYQYTTDNGTSWKLIPGSDNAPTTVTSGIITQTSATGTTPLANGTTYTVKIRATNATGANGATVGGVASGSKSAAPKAAGVPGTPTLVSAVAGDGYVILTWTLADDGGSDITGYQYATDDATWKTLPVTNPASDLTATVRTVSTGSTALINGTTYTFKIRAKNGNQADYGPASGTKSATPALFTVTAWGNSTRTNSTTGTAQVTFSGSGSFYWYVGATASTTPGDWSAAVASTTSPQTITITGLTDRTAAKVWITTDKTNASTLADKTFATPADIPAVPGTSGTAPTITVNNLRSGNGLDVPVNVINAPIVTYVGNITTRLNVSVAEVTNKPVNFDPAASLLYTWYLTTAANNADIYYVAQGNHPKNTTMVKSTTTSANGGTFFQVPEGLTGDVDGTTYKYFATVTAPSLGAAVIGESNIVSVTVYARPEITVTTPADKVSTNDPSTNNGALTEGANVATAAAQLVTIPTITNGGFVNTTLANKGTFKYEWLWTSKNGTGGGVAQAAVYNAEIITNATATQTGSTFTIPNNTTSGLPAGVYYFRCEVTYGTSPTPGSETGTTFIPLSIPVKTNTVKVEVKPSDPGKTLIPSTATINIADVTTLEYQLVGDESLASGANNTSGRKLFVTIPTSGLVSNITGATASTFTATHVTYTKTLPKAVAAHGFDRDITTVGNDGKFNFGVKNAGTYDVMVKIEGTVTPATGTPVNYVGWKRVLLVVKPKPLSGIAASSFSVKAPANDTIYNGLSKTPLVEIKDGTYTLQRGIDYKVNPPAQTKDWINAGSANVTVSGCAVQLEASNLCFDAEQDANYTGDRVGSFTIRRMPLAINAVASTVDGKEYDGTDTLGANSIHVEFNPQPVEPEFKKGVDYIISGAKFDNKDVGASRTVSAITVKLDEANSPLAKNYTFGAVNATAVLSATFSKTGVPIRKQTPSASFLRYAIPTTHLYNGQARGIGSVDWKTGVTNPGQSAFEIFYATGVNPPTKELPKGETGGVTGEGVLPGAAPISYVVSVSVRGGSNFNDGVIYFKKADGVSDTTYTIGARGKLDKIATKPSQKAPDATEDTTVYVGMSLALKATAVRPDSVSWIVYGDDGITPLKNSEDQDSIFRVKYKGGTIAYQWYKVPNASSNGSGTTADTKWDTLKTSSAKTDTYTLPQPLKETVGDAREYYQVRAIWTYPAVTIPDTSYITVLGSSAHRAIGVRIGPEPKSLADAEITVAGSYPYTGVIYELAATDFSVSLMGEDGQVKTLTEANGDFSFVSYGLNAGKGAGTVTITGKNAYKGTAIGYFDIDQIPTDESWLVFGTTRQYNDSVQEFSVTPRTGLTGLGKVTRVYMKAKGGDDENAYDTLSGAPKAVGNYMVSVKIDEGINFTAMDEFVKPFSIVKRVLTNSDFIYDFPEEHAYTGVPLPLVTAKMKTNVVGYTGDYKVVLLVGNTETDLTAMPTAEGAYKIYVSVEGDDNFANAMVLLGTYTIHEEGWVGVKGSDRVILPVKPEVKVVTVAPVKVAAAVTFTAGPSPVSKVSGKIAFFSTKSVKSGSLYIFDASGNAVAKLSAKTGSGEIASWNLKDKKGATVAEGSYVVKGALAGKDGTREKVSFVFSVVK